MLGLVAVNRGLGRTCVLHLGRARGEGEREVSSIDTEYLEYVADMLKQIRNQLAALNLGLAELNLGIGALIGEKQVKNGNWVSLDSLKPQPSEYDRLRAIEAAARDAMRQIDRTLWLEHETGFLHDLRNNARICDLRAALAAKEGDNGKA
jgi:hypothetical protein